MDIQGTVNVTDGPRSMVCNRKEVKNNLKWLMYYGNPQNGIPCSYFKKEKLLCRYGYENLFTRQ